MYPVNYEKQSQKTQGILYDDPGKISRGSWRLLDSYIQVRARQDQSEYSHGIEISKGIAHKSRVPLGTRAGRYALNYTVSSPREKQTSTHQYTVYILYLIRRKLYSTGVASDRILASLQTLKCILTLTFCKKLFTWGNSVLFGDKPVTPKLAMRYMTC